MFTILRIFGERDSIKEFANNIKSLDIDCSVLDEGLSAEFWLSLETENHFDQVMSTLRTCKAFLDGAVANKCEFIVDIGIDFHEHSGFPLTVLTMPKDFMLAISGMELRVTIYGDV